MYSHGLVSFSCVDQKKWLCRCVTIVLFCWYILSRAASHKMLAKRFCERNYIILCLVNASFVATYLGMKFSFCYLTLMFVSLHFFFVLK